MGTTVSTFASWSTRCWWCGGQIPRLTLIFGDRNDQGQVEWWGHPECVDLYRAGETRPVPEPRKDYTSSAATKANAAARRRTRAKRAQT